MEENELAIEVKDLCFSYSQTDSSLLTLNNVSFSLKKGNYISLIGHNGSGKSTLAKLLIGLLEKKSGSIKIFSQEISAKSLLDLRKRIGIVFQNPDNQFIGATVRDDIAFGLENRCIPHEDMEGIITSFAKKVNMEKYLDKEPSNLSGGQKQRVAIAGVLAMHPDIVIFDEATAMLDPKGKREIREIIEEMRKENGDLTIISITHEIEEAFLSDEIVVLNKGEVYLKGTPSEILENKDKLEAINLDIPFYAHLLDALKEQGIDIKDIHNESELVKYLCR